MNDIKFSIIIVTPNADMPAAIYLREKLDNEHSIKNVTIWTTEQYEHNSAQIISEQPFIFLGGPNGNKITRVFIKSGALSEVFKANSFSIYCSSRKYFLCGNIAAPSTEDAVKHFLRYYIDDFIKLLPRKE